MTHTFDPFARSISRGQSDGHVDRQPTPHHPTRTRGLSDRQAMIAAMAANGFTCQDIAFELLLPLRTVQGHLLIVLRVLDLSRVEDLTFEVIAAHQARNSATVTTRSEGPTSVGSDRSTDDNQPPNSLVSLDAAEADTETALETQVADLTLELTVARAELDEQRRKVQQLHEAVESRDSIGQAKGILMERHRIGAADAFTSLQGESNRTNRKVADVAKSLVLTGEEST